RPVPHSNRLATSWTVSSRSSLSPSVCLRVRANSQPRHLKPRLPCLRQQAYAVRFAGNGKLERRTFRSSRAAASSPTASTSDPGDVLVLRGLEGGDLISDRNPSLQ